MLRPLLAASEAMSQAAAPARRAVALTPVVMTAAIALLAAVARADHLVVDRASSGALHEREARIELRRVLRERGFARRVPRGLDIDCRRRSALRFRCSFSRTLFGGAWRLTGSGHVYVLSRSYGALLRYRLNVKVAVAPPCEGSEARPCVAHFRFTYVNHQRVHAGG